MPPQTLRARTLHRALAVAGSERRLARRLFVPESVLRSWLAGKDSPPTGVFLAAIDVIESQYGFVERRRVSRSGPWMIS